MLAPGVLLPDWQESWLAGGRNEASAEETPHFVSLKDPTLAVWPSVSCL